jgi:ribokinase
MAGKIPKIVVIGPVFVDMAIRCHSFPGPGEVTDGSGFSCIAAGPGPNRAIEAALCGCESYLLGKVGADPFGELICENLRRYRVNTDFVYRVSAMSTGTVVTMINAQGQNCSCLSQGANRALSSDEVGCALAEQLIGSSNACLIHDNLPSDALVTVIRTAILHRTQTILEAQVPINEAGRLDTLSWPMEFFDVGVLVPDLRAWAARVETGAGMITQFKFIGADLVAKGVANVVLRLGSRGCLIVNRDGTRHIPGVGVESGDRQTCSDAFAGALSASIGAGDDLGRAVRFGYAAEVLSAGRFGGPDALPNKEEIIEQLQKQPD